MQCCRMGRIESIFLCLQPVARHRPAAARNELDPGQCQSIVHRKNWNSLGRSHVDEYDSAELVRRISALPRIRFESVRFRLARHFQYGAVGIVEPAVIAASNAALFDNSKFK